MKSAQGCLRLCRASPKAPHGLGYKLTVTRNNNNDVLNKAAANDVAVAKIVISGIHWYKPHYTLSVDQEAILYKQFLSKTPTEFQYGERTVFTKYVNTWTLWTFELRPQEAIKVPIWMIVRFQQRNWLKSAMENNDTFYTLLVTNAQCIIGTEKFPEGSVLLTYDNDEYSQV